MAFSAPEPGAPTATDTANGASAEHRPTPLLAALGAGDAAVAAVAKAFSDAFAAATTRRETVQHRVAELPTELEGLRARFSGRAADAVVDASAATADVVEDAGTATAEVIEDAGGEAASATRKTTGSGTVAGRTTGPKRTTTHPTSE